MSTGLPDPPDTIELVGQLKHEGPTVLLATLCGEWGLKNDTLIVERFATTRFEGPGLKPESGPAVGAPLEFVAVIASTVPGRHHGRLIVVQPGGIFLPLPPLLLEFTETQRTQRYSTVVPPIFDRTGVYWFCFAVDRKVVAHVPLEVTPGAPREHDDLLDEPVQLGLRTMPAKPRPRSN